MDLSQLHLPAGTNLTLVEVQQGATNIQHVENYINKEGREAEPFEEAYALLDKLTRGLMAQGKSEPRLLLMPYVAAVRAAAIPKMNYEDFNKRYGAKISAPSFSEYVGINAKYQDTDIEPYLKQFLKLEKGVFATQK